MTFMFDKFMTDDNQNQSMQRLANRANGCL